MALIVMISVMAIISMLNMTVPTIIMSLITIISVIDIKSAIGMNDIAHRSLILYVRPIKNLSFIDELFSITTIKIIKKNTLRTIYC